jgi:class 3 adenylate cyclase
MSTTKILIVDDGKLNRDLLEAMLRNAEPSYIILPAGDGPAALSLVGKEDPDLVLLDILMPGMDGFDVCRAIKEDPEHQFIPVVLITALDQLEAKIRGIDAGADDFLIKPVNRTELVSRVRSLVRLKKLHDQLVASHREINAKSQILKQVLDRYMSEAVSHEILKDPTRGLALGGARKKITTLFADIRGFTRFSTGRPVEETVSMLNVFFTEMTEVVVRHKGTIDKYMCDCLMAFFGAPIEHEDDAWRAVKAAIDMQRTFASKLHPQMPADHGLGLGIGINTGEAIVGNIGSHIVLDYTVIGDSVNVAAKLQEEADSGEILLAPATFEEVKPLLHVALASREISLKGSPSKVLAWSLRILQAAVRL